MRKKWYGPLIVSILITFLSIGTLIYITIYWNKNEISVNNQVVTKLEESTDSPDFKSIVHEAEKNVIQIEGNNKDDTITGSGFVFNDQGDIITNAHVIKDADVIQIRTANAHVYPAAVVGISEEIDVAVIRVPELARQNHLHIEENTYAEVGDEVIALGSPHGFQNTVTLGIISGDQRNFSADGFDYKDVYQISAQITHGNSGGPLINRSTGKVIGINAAGTEDGAIGFSIPIVDVMDQIKQWSKEVNNDDLDFGNLADVIDTNDPDELEEDVEYLVDYYFESVRIRDYLNAYTLLGSEMQTKVSYTDFREAYIHVVDIDYEQVSIELKENDTFQAIVDVTTEEQKKDKDKLKSEHHYTFTVGLENDQLKILKTDINQEEE